MTTVTANSYQEPRCGAREQFCGYWSKLAELVRDIFPFKSAPNLTAVTGISLRSSEYFLAQKSGLSGDAVVSLLTTKHGPDVLVALTAHSDEPWVRDFQRWWQMQQIKAQQAELQKRLDALEEPRRG